MRRVCRLALPFLAAVALAIPARADFIKNFPQWQQLGPDGQAAYGMAIFDMLTVVTANDQFTVARSVGLRACAISLQMKAGMVAQVINRYYAEHPDKRFVSPYVAFNGYVERGVCSPFINKAREEMGLPEMKAPPLPELNQQQGQQ